MFPWLRPTRTPIIIAHRGSSVSAPENTLAAFRRALVDRADAIELDVRLTADREVVVFHDAQLRRTTDGRGSAEDQRLDDLKRLSAGAWFGRAFAREKIPTLVEVFELLKDSQVGLNIEIKASRRSRRRFELVERCCDLIAEYH